MVMFNFSVVPRPFDKLLPVILLGRLSFTTMVLEKFLLTLGVFFTVLACLSRRTGSGVGFST